MFKITQIVSLASQQQQKKKIQKKNQFFFGNIFKIN